MSALARQGALVALLVLLGCAEKKDHPPLVGGCAPGQRCPTMFGNGSLGDSPDEQGAAGAGGESTAGELTGKVLDIVDDTFVAVQPYTDRAIVEGRGSGGGLVSAEWNGTDPFVLKDLEAEPTSWLSVRPERGQLGLRTLHAVATNISRRSDLGIVRRDTFDVLFGLLSTPTLVAAGTAQVVLIFTDASGTRAGVAGVRVVATDAALVAYRSGASWSTDTVATDGSGLVVLGNVYAQPFPGGSERIRLSGSASGYVDIQIATDAVTLVEVQLSP